MEKVAIKCKLFAIKQQRAVKNSDITQFLCGTIKIRRVENSINFHEFFSLGGATSMNAVKAEISQNSLSSEAFLLKFQQLKSEKAIYYCG